MNGEAVFKKTGALSICGTWFLDLGKENREQNSYRDFAQNLGRCGTIRFHNTKTDSKTHPWRARPFFFRSEVTKTDGDFGPVKLDLIPWFA